MDLIKIAKAISAVNEVFEDAKKAKSMDEFAPVTMFIRMLDTVTDDFVDKYVTPVHEALTKGEMPSFEKETSEEPDLKSVEYILKNINLDGSS